MMPPRMLTTLRDHIQPTMVTVNGHDSWTVSKSNRLSGPQRQAASRAKKKSAGFVRLTLRFDSKTASRLRRMAKSNNTTQANIVEAALVLLDNKQLLRDLQAWAAERKSNVARARSSPCGVSDTGFSE